MNAFTSYRTETIASASFLPPCSGYGGLRCGGSTAPHLPNSQQRGVISPTIALWPSLEENDNSAGTCPHKLASVVSLGRRAKQSLAEYCSRAFQQVSSLMGLSKPIEAQGLRYQSVSYLS